MYLISLISFYLDPPGKPRLEVDGHAKVEKNRKSENKIVIKENSTFTVTCKADGFPHPTCKWEDGNSPDLTFTNITKDAIGVYTCIAENVIKRSFPVYEVNNSTSTDLEIDVLCTYFIFIHALRFYNNIHNDLHGNYTSYLRVLLSVPFLI